MPNGTIISASGDKTIRFYDENFNCVNTIATTYYVRGLWVVPEVGFLSCGSQESLQLWSFDGQMIHDLRGSRDTVFGVTTLPSGEFVSCSEDGVTIWNGTEPGQTLVTPKCAWTVAALDNGDIVCGCQDRKIRVFTRDSTRFMSDELLAAYMEEAFNAAAEAAESAQPKRQVVNGVEYDEVIDVDLAEGQPTIPLGFNYNEQPVDIAQRFITEQNISPMYMDEITRFVQNTMAQRQINTGPSSAPYVDPFRDTEVPAQYGTNQLAPNRSQPNTSAAAAAKPAAKQETFPLLAPILVENGSAKTPYDKFVQLNAEMKQSSDPASVSDDLLATVTAVVEQLNANPIGSGTAQFKPEDLQGFLRVLTSVPSDKRYPLLDLARLAILYPEFSKHIGASTLTLAARDLESGFEASPFSQLMAVRVLLNGFKWKTNEAGLLEIAETVLGNLAELITNPKNKNIPSLAVSLLRNYATLLSTTKSELRYQVLSVAQEVLLGKELNPEFHFLALFSIGSMLSRDAQLILVANEMGVALEIKLHAASSNSDVKTAAQNVLSLFSSGVSK